MDILVGRCTPEAVSVTSRPGRGGGGQRRCNVLVLRLAMDLLALWLAARISSRYWLSREVITMTQSKPSRLTEYKDTCQSVEVKWYNGEENSR